MKRRSAALLVNGISSRDDGFAVVLVLMIIIIISMLGLTLLTAAAYQYRDTDRTKPSNRAFDLADCGLSYAHGYLARDIPIPAEGYSTGTMLLDAAHPESTFKVDIYNTATQYQYRIVSTGTYQNREGGGTRNYSRTLEEVVEYRGITGQLDAFNYALFSKEGSVSLNTGRFGVFSGSGLTVDGLGGRAIYAGTDVNLEDTKVLFAGGAINVKGDVHAGRDINITARSGLAATARVNVTGNLIAGRNVTVSSSTGCAADSNSSVTGSINALGNVDLNSSVGFICHASTKVASTANTAVNAGGNVSVTANSGVLADCETYVGASGCPSPVRAVGNSAVSATTGFLCGPESFIYGDLKNNGSASLSATGIGWQEARVNGTWQHGGACSRSGNTYVGAHSDVSPGIQTTDIAKVPDVVLPVPDWGWYKTMAIAQGNYHEGNYSISNVTIPDDPSSMWVLYVTGDVTIDQVLYNVQKKGVIVSEGDVSITHSVQLMDNSEYQVICKGNISHNSFLTLQTGANDRIFLYTDGTHDSNANGIKDDGNVSYDLGWFRDLKGQITARGNITAPIASFASFDHHTITYESPSVPVEGWPIPFKVLGFREL